MRSAENRWRGPDGEDDVEFGEESLRGFSGLLGSTVQITAVLRRFHGGSGRSGIAGGEKSGRRADILAATSGTIPAAAGAEVEDGGREVDPGARAELLAAQSYGAVEQGERAKLGLEAAVRVGRYGAQGVAERVKGGEAWDLGVRAGIDARCWLER